MDKRSQTKGTWLLLRGIAIGLLFGALISFAVAPAIKSVFGSNSFVVQILATCFFFGLFMKAILLGQLARKVDIIPQTPAEFAGVREMTAVFTPQPSPLPEVPSAVRPVGKPQPLTQLDFHKLEMVTTELQALGFTLASEGAVDTGRKNGPAMFERMFEHPIGAFVELYQLFPVIGSPLPVSLAIFSYYPDDWRVIDSNQKANWIAWMWTTPRTLTKGHAEDVSIRDMWQLHLERRAQVEAGLKVQAQAHSVEDHLANAREFVIFMRKSLIRRSLLMAWVRHKSRPKNRELWGEFHKFAKL